MMDDLKRLGEDLTEASSLPRDAEKHVNQAVKSLEAMATRVADARLIVRNLLTEASRLPEHLTFCAQQMEGVEAQQTRLEDLKTTLDHMARDPRYGSFFEDKEDTVPAVHTLYQEIRAAYADLEHLRWIMQEHNVDAEGGQREGSVISTEQEIDDFFARLCIGE